jgi:hypothetical protein
VPGDLRGPVVSFTPGEGPRGIGRGIDQSHLLPYDLNGAEAQSEQENHGGQRGRELRRDRARLVPALTAPGQPATAATALADVSPR